MTSRQVGIHHSVVNEDELVDNDARSGLPNIQNQMSDIVSPNTEFNDVGSNLIIINEQTPIDQKSFTTKKKSNKTSRNQNSIANSKTDY